MFINTIFNKFYFGNFVIQSPGSLYFLFRLLMNEITFKIEETNGGGLMAEAYISENEQIITQAENEAELKMMIKDALECHFDNADEIPHRVILQFIRSEIFAF